MTTITDKLAAALRGLIKQCDEASSEGRFADGMGSELTALDDATAALAEYDAARGACRHHHINMGQFFMTCRDCGRVIEG